MDWGPGRSRTYPGPQSIVSIVNNEVWLARLNSQSLTVQQSKRTRARNKNLMLAQGGAEPPTSIFGGGGGGGGGNSPPSPPCSAAPALDSQLASQTYMYFIIEREHKPLGYRHIQVYMQLCYVLWLKKLQSGGREGATPPPAPTPALNQFHLIAFPNLAVLYM